MKTKLSLCLGVLSALLMPQVSPARASEMLSPQAAKKAVGQRSLAVVRALKNRDTRTLSLYVDAKRGLRFSPYIFAETSDKVLSVSQVRRLSRDRKRYLWGSYDGTGDPIRLTWNDYRKSFVYPRHYFVVPPTFHTSMSRGNLKQIYPRGIFVRYYTPGVNPEFGGLDWRSLWLVWNRSGNAWKLVAIASDQWTT